MATEKPTKALEKKPRCEACGGTGLSDEKDGGGVCRLCPAGQARDASDYSFGLYD